MKVSSRGSCIEHSVPSWQYCLGSKFRRWPCLRSMSLEADFQNLKTQQFQFDRSASHSGFKMWALSLLFQATMPVPLLLRCPHHHWLSFLWNWNCFFYTLPWSRYFYHSCRKTETSTRMPVTLKNPPNLPPSKIRTRQSQPQKQESSEGSRWRRRGSHGLNLKSPFQAHGWGAPYPEWHGHRAPVGSLGEWLSLALATLSASWHGTMWGATLPCHHGLCHGGLRPRKQPK